MFNQTTIQPNLEQTIDMYVAYFVIQLTKPVGLYRVVPFGWDKLSGWVEGAQASVLRQDTWGRKCTLRALEPFEVCASGQATHLAPGRKGKL